MAPCGLSIAFCCRNSDSIYEHYFGRHAQACRFSFSPYLTIRTGGARFDLGQWRFREELPDERLQLAGDRRNQEACCGALSGGNVVDTRRPEISDTVAVPEIQLSQLVWLGNLLTES